MFTFLLDLWIFSTVHLHYAVLAGCSWEVLRIDTSSFPEDECSPECSFYFCKWPLLRNAVQTPSAISPSDLCWRPYSRQLLRSADTRGSHKVNYPALPGWQQRQKNAACPLGKVWLFNNWKWWGFLVYWFINKMEIFLGFTLQQGGFYMVRKGIFV